MKNKMGKIKTKIQIVACIVFAIFAMTGCALKGVSLEGTDWKFVSMDYDGTNITVAGLNAIGWDLPTIVFTRDNFIMDSFSGKLEGKWKSVGDNQYRLSGTEDSEDDYFEGVLKIEDNKQILTLTVDTGENNVVMIFERPNK